MAVLLHDVIIVGAGPAGATAANLLAQNGLDVLMIDRSKQPSAQLPQTCFGLRTQLLERLGVNEDIFAAIEIPKPVRFLGADGGFDFQIAVQPRGVETGFQGMRLNRTYFDQLLVNSAIHNGATYISSIQSERFIEKDGSICGVRCHTAHGVEEYYSRIVIDASGKSSLLANQLGLLRKGHKLDDRIAVFSHFIGSGFSKLLPDGGMTVLTIDGGYLLLAPMAGQRVTIIAVLADSKAALHESEWERLFRDAIRQWNDLTEVLKQSQQVLPVLPVINKTWICKQFCGPGYFIVGEAAAFTDPFISNGLAIAMDSGELAANALIQCWKHKDEWKDSVYFDSYNAASLELFDRRQAEARDWVDSLAAQQLMMACADPHLPWIVPLALLNLFFGAGLIIEDSIKPQGSSFLSAARQAYSTYASPV